MTIIHTIETAKRDMQIGYLRHYRIERGPLGSGWIISLGEGNSLGWLCDARKKEPRVFKTLDAAVGALEIVGFKIDALFQG